MGAVWGGGGVQEGWLGGAVQVGRFGGGGVVGVLGPAECPPPPPGREVPQVDRGGHPRVASPQTGTRESLSHR